MALDARYILIGDLQQLFVDKDTSLPLTAGIVTFYSDVNRTVLKPVYELTGDQSNYSFAPLQNPMVLGEGGTFVDNDGNIIVPYYFPYDAEGNIELYYIKVVSAELVPQFTRQAWPNVVSENATAETIENKIPNGQFILHTDVPATRNSVAGEITEDITNIADGGWTFERSTGSNATDFVVFTRIASPVSQPTDNPRYVLTVSCTVPDAGDTTKSVRLRFNDVNKFASEDQEWTLSFTGQDNLGASLTVDLNLIKNYGTGGSTPTNDTIQTVNIPSSYGVINIPFVFGVNDGKTIGPDDDDYVQLDLEFPSDTAFSASVSDFILTPGNVIVSEFPQTTTSEFIYQAMFGAGNVFAYDGSDFYLPIVRTPTGFRSDDSQVGKIYSSVATDLSVGELACNGDSYITSAYSTNGIPYRRLQEKLFDATAKLPRFGTGLENLSAYIADLSPASNLRISTNQPSSAITNAANGAISPGFSINTIHPSGEYAVLGYINGADTFIVVSDIAGAVTAPTAGTSTFTVTDLINQASHKHIFQVQTVAATGLAGLYFTFVTTTTTYYVWYTVDSGGSDPTPGGTGIKVELLSTYTAADVARITREAISGFQVTTVVTVAASGMTAGCYFTINTFDDSYYVYYVIAGIGTNPNLPGKIGILITLAGTETDAQVATKTQLAINNTWFAVPYFNQGMFLRGIDPNSITDYDSASRYSVLSNLYGDALGTFEFDETGIHAHTGTLDSQFTRLGVGPNTVSGGGGSLSNTTGTITINPSTGPESRPVNAYVNFVIKY